MTLQHPEVRFNGVSRLHGLQSRAYFDSGVDLAGRTVTVSRIEPRVYDSTTTKSANPRLALLWPHGLPGIAALDLFEENRKIVEDSRGNSLDTSSRAQEDGERGRLTRVLLARDWMSMGTITFAPEASIAEEAKKARHEGAMVDIDVAVFDTLDDDGHIDVRRDPAQWLRISGVPLPELQDGEDEGEFWELGAHLRFKPFEKFEPTTLLEQYATRDWDEEGPEPESHGFARVRRLELVSMALKESRDAAEGKPLHERMVLAVDRVLAFQGGKQTDELELKVYVTHAWSGTDAAEGRVVMHWLQNVSVKAIPATKDKPALPGLADIPPPLNGGPKPKKPKKPKKGKKAPKAPKPVTGIHGFDITINGKSRNVAEFVKRKVVARSYYLLLPPDVQHSGFGQLTGVDGKSRPSGFPADTKIGSVHHVDLVLDDGWEAYASDMLEILQHLRRAEAWAALHAKLFEKWKSEMETFDCVVAPIFQAFGDVQLMTAGYTVGGRHLKKLEDLTSDRWASMVRKQHRLARITARTERHAKAAWDVFMRERFQRIYHTKDEYQTLGRVLTCPAVSEKEDDDAISLPAEEYRYDAELKAFLLCATAAAGPMLCQPTDETGQAHPDPTLPKRRGEFRKAMQPALLALYRAQVKVDDESDEVAAYFLNAAVSGEHVWQVAAESGITAFFLGDDEMRDQIAEVLFGKGTTVADLKGKDYDWTILSVDIARRHHHLKTSLEGLELLVNGIKLISDISSILEKDRKLSRVSDVVDLLDVAVSLAEITLKLTKLALGRVVASTFISKTGKALGRIAAVIEFANEAVALFETLYDASNGRDVDLDEILKPMVNMMLAVVAIAVPGVGQLMLVIGLFYLAVEAFIYLWKDHPTEAIPKWFSRTPWGENKLSNYGGDYDLDDAAGMFKGAVAALNDFYKTIYTGADAEARKALKTFLLTYVAANAKRYGVYYEVKEHEGGKISPPWIEIKLS